MAGHETSTGRILLEQVFASANESIQQSDKFSGAESYMQPYVGDLSGFQLHHVAFVHDLARCHLSCKSPFSLASRLHAESVRQASQRKKTRRLAGNMMGLHDAFATLHVQKESAEHIFIIASPKPFVGLAMWSAKFFTSLCFLSCVKHDMRSFV